MGDNPRTAVIVDGIRTPFSKAWGALAGVPARELARVCIRELLDRSGLPAVEVDEVVLGNASMPADAPNIARVASLLAGVPDHVPAMTVQRNCASGMEALFQACSRIESGDAHVVVAGGVESMSRVPMHLPAQTTERMRDLARARGPFAKLKAALAFRPRHFSAKSALLEGLTDPVCGLTMPETAEHLARRFGVSRAAQDEFAIESHRRALSAREMGFFDDEIAPVFVPPRFRDVVVADDGPRVGQSHHALDRLRPVAGGRTGTVTAGNSSQVTDGGCALLVVEAGHAEKLGLTPLATVRARAVRACPPEWMGLGPVYAMRPALHDAGLGLGDVGLFEINEAFAAQVLAVREALATGNTVERDADRREPLGEVPADRLNVHGGAISLGHPIGASGTRIVLTLARAMRARDERHGLAALCIGGGQGAAVILERGA